MEYRTVYGNSKVISSVVNDDKSITYSKDKFIIDEQNPSRDRMFLWGVDPSYLWENDISDRYNPDPEDEVPITSAEINGLTYERKASGYLSELPGNQFRFNILVRHFLNGQYYHDEFMDDYMVSRIIDNSQTVDDGQGNQVPEYAYFKSLIESGSIGFFSLKKANILQLDSLGLLN